MKVTTIGQVLFMLMVGCAQVAACSALSGNETDRLSLLEFKKAIDSDPQQALLTWNDSTHFCHWEGIRCRVKNPVRVISLDLENRGLIGRISPSLGNLTFLKHLVLSTNSFTAEIPRSLCHLHHLELLEVSNNFLQGSIPSLANNSNLRWIMLDGNNLAGKIPADLPPNLRVMGFSTNNLSGTIPSSLPNITTLQVLDVSFNHISGEVPKDIGKLRSLQTFSVGSNKMSGRFEPNILNLSSLVIVSLGPNYLSGQLPSNLGSSLHNLQMFGVFGNHFEGPIPSSLVNASKLFLVDLSTNNFTGVVPSSVGKLKELTWLNLEFNQLQARNKQDMEFMNTLSNCTKLEKLSLMGNHLQGQIPNNFGNLSVKLQQFYFGDNRLSGSLPSGLANLHSLSGLGLEMNQFSGVIPEWLGSLKKLQAISLSGNMFTGNIPSTLSNLSQLGRLYLDSNLLYGHIPLSMGNLKVLESLEISYNNLHGTVPKEIFNIPTIMYIGLSSNSLNGPLPVEVGNAKQLQYLLLSSNNLSNSIPGTLGNCDSMEDIELDQNVLSGGIPASLGNITSLKILNVSNNHLSGSIPMSIGSLQYLQQLDLSFNYLEGQVPEKGVFRNTSAIWIAGNKGLCGGAAMLQLPACSVILPSSSTKHMPYVVLKVLIPLAILTSLAIVISVLLVWRNKQKTKNISLPSFGRKFPRVSYSDLARATDGFSPSNLIGTGRYSSVYKGKLFQEGIMVAVKVFSLETRGAQKSFIAECNALRNVRHRNLVPVLTACSSINSEGNDFKALVYEYMPQGDLHVLLYPTLCDENTSDLNQITLSQRLSIVVDVADALEYLHHNNLGTVIHCDLKPSNILLDDDMTAYVGDFGLASFKIASTLSSLGDSELTTSIAIRGTIGYVAPECAIDGHVSTAADVYSFGIVLLEIFIRKRPTDDMFKDGLDIAKFVEMNFPAKIPQIIDSQLLQNQPNFSQETPAAIEEKDMECLISVLNIGLCCTKLSPNERLNMQEVAKRLHVIRETYLKGN